jgi:hypothetical protein
MLFLSSRTSAQGPCPPPQGLRLMLLKLLSAMTITLGTLIRLMERISRLMVRLLHLQPRHPHK